MKLKYTIAALAVTTMAANAAVIATGDRVSGGKANLSADAGQTFTTLGLGLETALSTIAIQGPDAATGTDPMGPFTLEVWTDLDGDHSTWGTGTLVATSDSQSMNTSATYTTFNFGGEELSSNTVYAFTYTDGAGTRIAARAGLTNVDDIANGSLFSGGTKPFSDAYDLSMVITTTTAVPEPSSTALLGLGGLALILRRRK